MRLPPMIALALAAALPAVAQTPDAHKAELKTGKGIAAGTVTLSAAPKGILLVVEASALTPGWHAIHIHEKGDCSDAAFKSAGGHVHAAGTTPAVHGLLNPNETDQGDLPNIYVGADGMAKAEIYTSLTTLPALLDADGSSIVIHAKPDDHMSQPIGGAGERVACGVIK